MAAEAITIRSQVTVAGAFWVRLLPAVAILLLIAAGLIAPAAAEGAAPTSNFAPQWTRESAAASAGVLGSLGDFVLVGDCSIVRADGSVAYYTPRNTSGRPDCDAQVADAAGNVFFYRDGAIHAQESSGAARWATSTGRFSPWRGTAPVLGVDGSVFFSLFDGFRSKVIGLSTATGAITLERLYSDVTGLHAYSQGLVVVNGATQVEYVRYDGTPVARHTTSQALTSYQAYSNEGGIDEAVFLAGYGPDCEGLSVESFTEAGRRWTWTADGNQSCRSTVLSATPDGGVILGHSEQLSPSSADYVSLSPGGAVRWIHHAEGDSEAASGPLRAFRWVDKPAPARR